MRNKVLIGVGWLLVALALWLFPWLAGKLTPQVIEKEIIVPRIVEKVVEKIIYKEGKEIVEVEVIKLHPVFDIKQLNAPPKHRPFEGNAFAYHYTIRVNAPYYSQSGWDIYAKANDDGYIVSMNPIGRTQNGMNCVTGNTVDWR